MLPNESFAQGVDDFVSDVCSNLVVVSAKKDLRCESAKAISCDRVQLFLTQSGLIVNCGDIVRVEVVHVEYLHRGSP